MANDKTANGDEPTTNGGDNYSELHERVQTAMKPYTSEILDAKYTSILAEDDEYWYLSVHWGEYDALLSDNVLTSEEYDIIHSEYNTIVGDKWRNADVETRWSNTPPYGDTYAMVLKKPEDEPELKTDGGADVADNLVGETGEFDCSLCGGILCENHTQREVAGDEVKLHVRCVHCGHFGRIDVKAGNALRASGIATRNYDPQKYVGYETKSPTDWTDEGWREAAAQEGVILNA